MEDLEEIVIDGKRTGTEQPPRQETALTTMDGYMEEVHFIMVPFLGFKCSHPIGPVMSETLFYFLH